jgi:putative hemolysin
MISFISIALMILVMLLLLWLAAWFSGTETALTNLQAHEIALMKRNKEKNIDYIVKLRSDMDRTLITILIGNDLVNILLSSLAALFAEALFGSFGISLTIGIVTFIFIILGDIVPKSNAILHNRKVSSNNARAIYYITRIFYPIIVIFVFLSKLVLRIGGVKQEPPKMVISEEHIKSLITIQEESGLIKKIEKDIIYKVYRFGDRKIKGIMVPMKKVFALKKNYTVNKARKMIAEHGFTRVPVMFKGRVVGLVYSKDLLRSHPRKRIADIMRVTFVVPEYYDITVLFKLMKKVRIHMAIVKDRKDNHIGIATMEDILEELVGEIYDEFEENKYVEVQKLGDAPADLPKD